MSDSRDSYVAAVTADLGEPADGVKTLHALLLGHLPDGSEATTYRIVPNDKNDLQGAFREMSSESADWLLDRVQALEAALFECAKQSGADISDGVPTSPPIEVWAVDCVKQLRADYDEALEDIPW